MSSLQSTSRPTANPGRSAAGWVQTVLHRYRGIRWVAAAGAAGIAFLVLNSNPGNTAESSLDNTATMLEHDQPAARLPVVTRGVVVPSESMLLTPGDRVDVHEVRTGAAVVHNALVVEVTEDDTMIAVPLDRVDPLVDALTTGGVILALVPQSASAPAKT